MLNRFFSLAILVCAAGSVAAYGAATPGQELLFQYFSQPSSNPQFTSYLDASNLAQPLATGNGPTGMAQVIPSPLTGGFFLVGVTAANSLQAADSTLTVFTTLNGLGAPPTAATVTPDGKYLLVAADAFYIFDATTNQLLTPGGLQMAGSASFNPDDTPGTCISCWIAVSPDSQSAFVLTNSPFSSTLTEYNLATRTRVGSLNTGGEATSVSVSPLGQLYVTAEFLIYVINPSTFILNANNNIPISFEPAILRYSPDGTTAYTVNRQAKTGGGPSMAQINLATGAVVTWPAANTGTSTQFSDIYVASNSRIFTFAPDLNQLLDVTVNPFAAQPVTSIPSTQVPTVVLQNEVLAVAVSNELPQAHWLFLLDANGNQTDLYRVDLTSTTAAPTVTLSTFNGGVLQTTFLPDNTGPTQFLQFNNSQNLPNGGLSQPLLVTVLDAAGLPVFGQPVTFSTDPTTGLVITSPQGTTNANGTALTTVSVPTAGASCPQGVCTITVTAGGATATFTVTVPSSGSTCTSNCTGGGTSSQIQVYSGNGQLLEAGFGQVGGAVPDPLVVQVTDVNGKPLPNVPVSFSVTSGPGTIDNVQAVGASGGATTQTTDMNGFAEVGFVSQGLAIGSGQQATTIVATSTTVPGSATFTIVEFALDFGGTGIPQTNLLSPANNQPLQVTSGTPLTAGIQAQVLSTAQNNTGAPVPGVGIFIVDPDNPTNDPAGVQPAVQCGAGSTLSDPNTGIASCNVVAQTCTSETRGINIFVGNLRYFPATVQINAGGATTISIVQGNNQSGRSGTTVTTPLVAQVNNACGSPVPGVAVTWTTTGSVALSGTNLITSPSGQVSTNATFGQNPGPITVTATLSNGASAVFKLTDVISAASLKLVSGNNQTATIGQQFAAPLVFQVSDSSGNGLSGVPVTFSVQSGSASVTPVGISTNAAGQAQTVVTAGSNSAGPIVISATANGFVATANLTSLPQGPSITASSFQNAASFAPGLTPCGLAVVTGNGVAPGVQGVVTGPAFGPLGFSLGPVNSLLINGSPAPLSSVSNENGVQQITFQTPCEVAPGPATVVLMVNQVSSTITAVPVLTAQPGIFTYTGPNGKQYGAVIRALDGSYVTPTNYAHRGETYYIEVTGLGQTTPAATTDNAGNGQPVNAQVIAGVNNAGVGTGAATYAQGLLGVYLVPFQIPLTAATGPDQPLAVGVITTLNGQTTVTFSNSPLIPGVQ